jgi:hypothetical protein
VHGTPAGVIRIILIEQMVLPLINGKTVGVIHPSDSGYYMKKRPFLPGDPVSVNLFIISGLFQLRIHPLSCLLAYPDAATIPTIIPEIIPEKTATPTSDNAFIPIIIQ